MNTSTQLSYLENGIIVMLRCARCLNYEDKPLSAKTLVANHTRCQHNYYHPVQVLLTTKALNIKHCMDQQAIEIAEAAALKELFTGNYVFVNSHG